MTTIQYPKPKSGINKTTQQRGYKDTISYV
uniref:Uncharacterized protein n=1 Tax=Arundo donax TaxID=35708 RepID=A0A0A8Y0A0_ARUDO